MTTDNTKLFRPFTFNKGLTVKNKIAMAPMTTWASNDDYTTSDEEHKHYRARVNGPGLVITGCSRVTPNGIGFTHEFACYDDAFLPSLKKLAAAAKSGGAPAILQIYHAGNKAVADLVPSGDVVSASAVEVGLTAFVDGSHTPRALTQDEILHIIKDFGAATKRAIAAGFDGVELHGAHGFLLQNFFSPFFNQRTDYWGGTAENRMHFPLEVVKEVRKTIEENTDRPFLLGYRISPEESQPESYKINDTYPLIDRLIETGIDYLHLSLTNVLESKPIEAPEGKTIAALILDHINGRIPVIAAGQIKTPEEAVHAIDLGLALVAIGQAIVINPDWVLRAAKGESLDKGLSLSKLPELSIPRKLSAVIEKAEGWFQLTD